MFWVTAYGPGVTPDSVDYIETAKSLLAGNGFFVGGQPMTWFPPAYPLLLSVASLFQHGDILQTARFLHAFLFGSNIVLIGLAVQMCTERSLLAAGCAMLLFLFSAPVISVESMAMSEPPFITFTLAAFILLSRYVVCPSIYLLLAASVSFGLAISTRYVGVALLPPMAFALLLFGNRPIRFRIRDTFVATTVACLPLCAWLIRNFMTAQTTTHRTFAIHLFDYHHAKMLFATMLDFDLPGFIPGRTLLLGVAAALFVIALVVLHRRNYIRLKLHSVHIVLPLVCIVFCVAYVAFLAVSISFFDAKTPLDARILLPVFSVLTVVVTALAWSLSQALEKRVIWLSFIFFVCLLVSINSGNVVREAIAIHENGSGYSSRQWRSSAAILLVKSLGRGVTIYSNGPDVIQFLTGKEAVMIPPHTVSLTMAPNEHYGEQLQIMFKKCGEGEAIIVYLNKITWRWYLPTQNELELEHGITVLSRVDDGTIYGRQL